MYRLINHDHISSRALKIMFIVSDEAACALMHAALQRQVVSSKRIEETKWHVLVLVLGHKLGQCIQNTNDKPESIITLKKTEKN